ANRSEGVGPGDPAQPGGAGLGGADLRFPVDRDEAERRPVPVDPLEVVERAPVAVAPHVDAVGETSQDAVEGPLYVGDAPGVVTGADAVLGDELGQAVGVGPRASHARFERLGPELVA